MYMLITTVVRTVPGKPPSPHALPSMCFITHDNLRRATVQHGSALVVPGSGERVVGRPTVDAVRRLLSAGCAPATKLCWRRPSNHRQTDIRPSEPYFTQLSASGRGKTKTSPLSYSCMVSVNPHGERTSIQLQGYV